MAFKCRYVKVVKIKALKVYTERYRDRDRDRGRDRGRVQHRVIYPILYYLSGGAL